MKLNQKGVIPVLMLLAAVGLIGFLIFASTASFKGGLFAALFPKKSSFASGPVSAPITPSPVPYTQANYFVPTPTPAPLDSDKDGWSDQKEIFVGTNRLDACSDTKSDNAWPPDLNNDQKVNGIDFTDMSNALRVKARDGKTAYNPRFDLNTDGVLNQSDLELLDTYWGQVCVNPTPTPTLAPTPKPKSTPVPPKGR